MIATDEAGSAGRSSFEAPAGGFPIELFLGQMRGASGATGGRARNASPAPKGRPLDAAPEPPDEVAVLLARLSLAVMGEPEAAVFALLEAVRQVQDRSGAPAEQAEAGADPASRG